MMDFKDRFWMWGYTQEKTGITLPFLADNKSSCSLESAADYFNMPNTIFMNSMHTWDRVEAHLQLLDESQKIICALPHGKQAGIEGARKISELSIKYPQIKGVVLDDFLQLSGHPTTVEMIRELKKELHSANKDLKLYVVLYSDANHLDVTPYLNFIDGIILWRWISTELFWKTEFSQLIHRYKEVYRKKLFHGVYLQNYGEFSNNAAPMEMELWKRQWLKILEAFLSPYQFLDGCVLLQNGWVGNPLFRDQVVWLRETIEWFITTNSIR